MAKGKKTGGRKPGSKNKVQTVVREVVEVALGGTLPEALLALTKGQGVTAAFKADIYLGLMPYCYPKLQATQLSGPGGGPVEIKTTPEQRKEEIKTLNQIVSAASDELSGS